jgi:hypothetical protein
MNFANKHRGMNKKTYGGKREGAGRPRRAEPKSKPIWCGQISEEQRQYIITSLTPTERFDALRQYAQDKFSHSGSTSMTVT